ncbi:MAG: tetratricopeptide repeat protein [Pseudomonadota bacterium]
MMRFSKLCFSLILASSLTACASSGTTPTGSYQSNNTNYNNSVAPEPTKSINTSTEKILAEAEAAGDKQLVLENLKTLHAENPEDPIVATRYGRALREDDQVNAAVRILTSFTKGTSASGEALTEMAMAQLALGKFETAEKYAERATSADKKNGRAYLALGTALDAQKKHQPAEIAFRKGLKYWKGKSTPILNNLALNLASQGHLEEALSLIEKAQKLAPGRMDLERNRRIIATLLETTGSRDLDAGS